MLASLIAGRLRVPGLLLFIFVGMANWTGLDTSAYSLVPLHLGHFTQPTWEEIGWTILLGVAAALVTYPLRGIGLRVADLTARRAWIVIPAAALASRADRPLLADDHAEAGCSSPVRRRSRDWSPIRGLVAGCARDGVAL
jgi:hypothetical protein